MVLVGMDGWVWAARDTRRQAACALSKCHNEGGERIGKKTRQYTSKKKEGKPLRLSGERACRGHGGRWERGMHVCVCVCVHERAWEKAAKQQHQKKNKQTHKQHNPREAKGVRGGACGQGACANATNACP